MCDNNFCLPEGTEVLVDFASTLAWYEYLIFGGVLVLSMGIGIFYGRFGTKNKTNEKFLMAGRSMSILPVTLSLVCSFVSAITLLGNPVEVYFYGQQYTMIAVAFIPMTAALAYLYVPVYFDLQLTSAYEVVYMPIAVLDPSLALDQAAGFDYQISAAAICLVCIAYSSIRGLKAVLWTDALQSVVMGVALLAIAACGVIEVGGFGMAWRRSEDAGRINFFNFDPDPRVRHTFWSGTIGGFLVWLPLFAATQAQIQRYNSVPTLRQARQCLLFNMVGMILVIIFCSFLGMLIFANYYNCDPVAAKIVSSPDQLLPLFVVDVLRNYPSLPGLLVAGITCGTLSTISSALNSLTALITEDFVKRFRPDRDEIRLGYASKIISTVTGLIAFGLVFVIRILNNTIQISPFSTLIHGSLLGPILRAFTLGMFFPWTNNLCSDFPDNEYLDLPHNSHWKDDHSSTLIKMFNPSYIWQPGIGVISTIIYGILFSFLVAAIDKSNKKKVHAKLLSKPFIRLWNKVFGEKMMQNWIDYDETVKFGKEKSEIVHKIVEEKSSQ